MSVLRQFYASTVGKKIAMAISGLVLVGFVIGHMLGNLKMFAGVDAAGIAKIDHYAVLLREIGAGFLGAETFLWITRAGLLAAVLIHIVSAIALARINRRAKPTNGRGLKYSSANAASRTMLYGGLFVAVFIVFHLLHFTGGMIEPQKFVAGQVYNNVVLGFQSISIALFYVAAVAFLSLHLYHGTWSVFQTLGVNSPRWDAGIRHAAKAIAVTLFVGFSAVPIAVQMGVLQPQTSTPSLDSGN